MNDALDFHSHYPDLTRYWSEVSEKFAGADSLLTRLQGGWSMDMDVFVEEFWHAGTRPVLVYHFSLSYGDESCNMPVINTPYIRRMIQLMRVNCRPLAEKTAANRAQRATS